ncbi:MAG: hypothetical protein AB8B91_11200 [Rubripirellula sp.]
MPVSNRIALDIRCRSRHSEGYVYVAVLFTTLIVMTAVTAALSISSSSLKSEVDRESRGEALRLAEAEIQRLAALMRTSGSWRTTSANDSFSNWHSLTLDGSSTSDTSQVRFRYNDSDGDLADDLADPVELTVHAKVGRSQAALKVDLESDPVPLDLLNYAVTATDDIQLDDGTLSTELPVQVSDNCQSNSVGLLTTPRIEIDGSVSTYLRGDSATASITLPSHDVVAEYISQGTQIQTASIPTAGSDLLIQDVVLSPAANPFGATDAKGIYWIDAGGAKLILSNCRLNATLAVRNATLVEINGGVVWNYPTTADVILATDSAVELTSITPTLDENTRNVNFNPALAPYRGTSNATNTDEYSTEFRGIFYSTGDFRLFNTGNPAVSLTGAVISSDLHVEGAMTIRQLSEVLTELPLGLRDSTPMRFVRGSFRRVPAP